LIRVGRRRRRNGFPLGKEVIEQMTVNQNEKKKEKEIKATEDEKKSEPPFILEEITVEELAVDGICGIY
jgi:mycofactocin precursor